MNSANPDENDFNFGSHCLPTTLMVFRSTKGKAHIEML